MSLQANVTSSKCCFKQMSLQANVASSKCRFKQCRLKQMSLQANVTQPFVHYNTHDIATWYCLPYLPWLHVTDRIISIYVMPPKVAKASTMVTVNHGAVAGVIALNFTNVNMALSSQNKNLYTLAAKHRPKRIQKLLIGPACLPCFG
jgi:hypothetical protein